MGSMKRKTIRIAPATIACTEMAGGATLNPKREECSTYASTASLLERERLASPNQDVDTARQRERIRLCRREAWGSTQ